MDARVAETPQTARPPTVESTDGLRRIASLVQRPWSFESLLPCAHSIDPIVVAESQTAVPRNSLTMQRGLPLWGERALNLKLHGRGKKSLSI